jgi:hypothetical protein
MLLAQWQKMQRTLEEKRGAIDCERGNVDVQWNNIKKCVLDTMRFGWTSQEVSMKAMNYRGNDQ